MHIIYIVVKIKLRLLHFTR